MILTRDGKEITAIYRQDGSEVEEVKDANGRLVYLASREITGTLPLSFSGRGKPLTDYLISGNTVQNGTPTPDMPIDVVGCGVRTGNVMPAGEQKTVVSYGVTFSSDGNGRYRIHGTSTAYASASFYLASGFTAPISVSNNGQGTLSFFNTGTNANVSISFYNGTTYVDNWVMSPQNRTSTAYKAIGNKYVDNVVIAVSPGETVDMIIAPEFTNDGVLPNEFEPYGYKLDITSGGENLLDAATAYSSMYDSATGVLVGAASTLTTIRNKFDSSMVGVPITISAHADEVPVTRVYIRCIIGGENIDSNAIANGKTGTMKVTVTPTSVNDDWRITFGTGSGDLTLSNLMLNLGSTALPYSPYNRIATPIFLGTVPTTRKIKKLVLTGEEDWMTSATTGGDNAFRINFSPLAKNQSSAISSHYINRVYGGTRFFIGSGLYALFFVDGSYETLADWKSYLAAQYQNGTPVTIWYVLAKPETAIVNEPLMKIDSYADTISFAQAGVTIPTVSGANVLDVPTEVKPSAVYIKGNGIKAIT